MSQRFVKGLTNNHLTWVMVDATDFATPESAMSAATKIKIYGKLRSATGVNFVSSGTGSLTNDIVHVGASALGIYTIALAKADLSDASAAWYDQYVISLSATGAAYQALVVDGGIIESSLSDLASNAYSAAVLAASRALIAQSGASDAASAAAQANSRILLVQSRLSDFDSRTASDFSDIYSALIAGVAMTASDMSDLRSAIAAGPAATVTASDISDIASAVRAAIVSDLSDILSAAVQANSRVLLVQSRLSDFDSRMVSDVSDIRSAIAAITASVSASDISDIASAVWAAKYTANSAASSFGSLFSDIYSRLTLTQSTASDAASASQQANSRILLVQSRLSDFDSRIASDISDIYSLLSDHHSTMNSQFAALSDVTSDILSTVGSQFAALSDASSNIASALTVIDSRVIATQNIASDAHSAAAILVAAHAEPTGVPAANASPLDKVGYMFAALRNKVTVTSSKMQFFDDAGVAMWEKDLTDDGTTYTETEGNIP